MYARELLLPCPLLRTWFLKDGLNASSIAASTQLPEGLVHHQLTHALLGPDLSGDHHSVEQRPEPELDDSQRDAAQAELGPVLVQAGPGTGKTRTLVARVTFLLDNQRVAPENILALTFSNKAAEELHERVTRSVPEAASSLWTGTFHAFGLELLRKHGTKLGLPPKPTVIDPIDALVLLDDSLSDLHLDHYQDLYEPARHLRSILNAISRAKDELVGPERYRELAMKCIGEPRLPETWSGPKRRRRWPKYLPSTKTGSLGNRCGRAGDNNERQSAAEAEFADQVNWRDGRPRVPRRTADIQRVSRIPAKALRGRAGSGTDTQQIACRGH